MKPESYYIIEEDLGKDGWANISIYSMFMSVADARMEIKSRKDLDRIYHRKGMRYRIAKITKEIVK